MSDSSILPPASAAAPRSGAGARRPVHSGAVPGRQARPLGRSRDPGGRHGSLVEEQLPDAAAELGLSGEDAAADAGEAWRVAVDTGLVEVVDEEEGTVRAGDELALLTGGSPQDVLGVWLGALETVLGDASVPDLGGLVDAIAGGEGSGSWTSTRWTGTRRPRRSSSTGCSATCIC